MSEQVRQALAELEDFLDGSKPLNGVWFGEPNPGIKGAYWWRKHMHEVFAAARSALSQPPEVKEAAAIRGCRTCALCFVDSHRCDMCHEDNNYKNYVPIAPPTAASAGVPSDVLAELEVALIVECERAMEQRDEFLKTGVSTAAHGGSHDTCFGHLLRKHLAAPPPAPALQPLTQAGEEPILPRVFRREMFDSVAFFSAVQSAMDARGVTAKGLAEATGVGETTLSRMRSGERICDAASLAALAGWAGLNPVKFCTLTPGAEAGKKRAFEQWITQPAWQPIETAPTPDDDDTFHAIVASPLDGGGGLYVEEAWWDHERREWWPANTDHTDAHGSAIYPTHWMPLPEAPSAQPSL